ncbi:MAG: LITAF-like zinc ribbon domain-containing protein [Acidobacteria bacterium]|nr:LITAF-like zinc ribbon domain-containing protein [Acidobacteriota bacterium]
MALCQNCGRENGPESNYCRFCGQPIPAVRSRTGDASARRPYTWQTDELQTKSEARRTIGSYDAPSNWPNAAVNDESLTPSEPQFVAGSYRCPNCMSQNLPIIEKRISTSGWIVFAVLIVVFFPLFWLGFFLKEEVRRCPVCRKVISQR